MEFGKACEDLSWNHCTSTPHRSETNGIPKRAVRRVKEGTSAVVLQSGLNESWWADSMECYTWADSMECYTHLRNVIDILSDGETPYEGESNIDFLGESEGSFPQPHDSLPVAGEAINDFWSMSGNFIYRHHVEPRVKLYSPREESFPIPLKYIDVSRTTHTNLDVKQEKRIDDNWNIDGSRDLSDPWTGFTQFTLLEEKLPDG